MPGLYSVLCSQQKVHLESWGVELAVYVVLRKGGTLINIKMHTHKRGS